MNEMDKCGICLEILEKTNVGITSCGHSFCLKCIIISTNYNKCCPYCRIDIIENEINKKEEMIEEPVIEEEETQYNYIGRIDYEDECYHFPVVIENIQTLAKVINEVTGGTFSSDFGLGWVVGILAIISDNMETKFNFIEDKNFENEILFAEHSKLIIMESLYIYERSLLLKKHLQNKLNK